GRADAQTESCEAVRASRLNKGVEQSAAKPFGPIILSHGHGNFRRGGVHETVGVQVRCPKAKPRGANSCATLLCNNRPISLPPPAGEQLRELRAITKPIERGAPGGCIPEECLKEHLLEKIQICRAAWSKLHHTFSSRQTLLVTGGGPVACGT